MSFFSHENRLTTKLWAVAVPYEHRANNVGKCRAVVPLRPGNFFSRLGNMTRNPLLTIVSSVGVLDGWRFMPIRT